MFVEIDGVRYVEPDQSGCSSLLEPLTILDMPILSPAPLRSFAQLGPGLAGADQDTMRLIGVLGDMVHEYRIEKSTYHIVQVYRYIAGDTTFQADYYYTDHHGIPALRMMALFGDTSITGQGGYRFSAIRINGETSVRSVRDSRDAVRPVRLIRAPGGLHLANPFSTRASYAILDTRGRRIGRGTLSRGARFIPLPRYGAAGRYLVRFDSPDGSRAIRIVVQ